LGYKSNFFEVRLLNTDLNSFESW